MPSPVISLRLPKELLDLMDQYIQPRGSFKDRTELIKAAILEYLEELE